MAAATGTGFVNLSNYLAANQDSINSTANNIAGQDTAAAQKAKGEDDAVGQSTYNQALNQGSGNTFNPTTVADYAQAQNDSSNAYANLQGLTGGKGPSTETQLQDTYGKQGNYGRGASGFDSALLGSSDQAQNTFQNAQNGFSNLNTYLGDTTNSQMAAGNAQNAVVNGAGYNADGWQGTGTDTSDGGHNYGIDGTHIVPYAETPQGTTESRPGTSGVDAGNSPSAQGGPQGFKSPQQGGQQSQPSNPTPTKSKWSF